MRNNIYKKYIAFLILFILVITPIENSLAVELNDINGTPYKKAVEALYERGIMGGYPDSTFRPDNLITRAEFAKIVTAAKGFSVEATFNEDANNPSIFTDVDRNHWAYNYIKEANKYGLVTGYGDGKFGPNDNLSYAAAATVLVRMLGLENSIDKKQQWPNNYISYAQEIGIIDDVEFVEPSDLATRGNVALMMHNSLRIMEGLSKLEELKINSLNLFTKEKDDTIEYFKLGKIKYEQGEDKYIGFELDINHKPVERPVLLPVKYILYSDFNSFRSPVWEKTILHKINPDTNKTLLQVKLDDEGLTQGSYRIDVLYGQDRIASREFRLIIDKVFIREFIANLNYKSIKFFATKFDPITKFHVDKADRVYKTNFEVNAYTDCICWELHIQFDEPGIKFPFPINVQYYYKDKYMIQDTFDWVIIEPDQTSLEFVGGLYVTNAVQWHSGKYEVRLYVYGHELARATFEIK